MADHDGLYHRLFSHPVLVADLVRAFLPEAMAAGVDFAGMERVVARFHDRSGQRRDSDVIWRLPLRPAESDLPAPAGWPKPEQAVTNAGVSASGRAARGVGEVYLHLLLEFQSTTDWWMAVRAQVYEGLLWQHIIAERRLKRGDRLPPVLLMVLYNGPGRWTAPTTTQALVALPPDSPLWPWQPRVRYSLLDMNRGGFDDATSRDNLARLLVELERPQEPEDLAAVIEAVIDWFRHHPDAQEVRRVLTELVRQALATADPGEARCPPDLMEMKTMLATLGEQWRRQWREEGLTEGVAKGLAEGVVRGRTEGLAEGVVRGRNEGLAEGVVRGRTEGLAEGRMDALVRLVERRFGPPNAAQSARLRDADRDQIDHWLDHVLDAPDLDSLLDLDRRS